MTVDSRFNLKSLRRDLGGLVVAVVFFLRSFLKSDSFSWAISVAILAGAALLVALAWLARQKRISVWSDGLEVTPVLFPFARRSYRFSEFDSMLVSGTAGSTKLSLVRDYRVIVTLRSSVYANFDELRHAIRIPECERMAVDPAREVCSRFVWWLPLLVVLCVALIGVGVALPVSKYLTEGVLDLIALVFGALLSALFVAGLLFLSVECRRITVWQGRIEAKPLLWPFGARHYRLSDFDGVYHVTSDSQSNMFADSHERWLMRNGTLALKISDGVYANYEELAAATRTNYLGSMKAGLFEQIRAILGKHYAYPQQHNS